MRRCVAPAHRMVALLLAAGLVRGAIRPRGADRVAETHQGDGSWEGRSCESGGDGRNVLDRWTPAAMERMGTCRRTGVPSLSTAWWRGGDYLGNEVPFFGTERSRALVRTR